MKIKYLYIFLLAICFVSCSRSFKVEDQEVVVIDEVLDGNTIVLENGLTVHLLGVSGEATITEGYLNNLIGKTVSLLPDSEGEGTFTSFDDEVWAYAMLDESGKPLNRELIKLGGKSAFNATYVNDSLEAYQAIVATNYHTLTEEQIANLLYASSFIIWGQDREGNLFNGTGFFISRDGLALSCSHVVNYESDYVVQLSDQQGQIINKPYSIKLPLYSGNYLRDPSDDFAIFYVDLDENAKRSIRPLALADKVPSAGSKIFTVGNPGVYGEVLPMSFAAGSLANVHTDDDLIQADINIGPGFSGGAMVDVYGRVFGINESILVDPNKNSKYVFLTDIQPVRAKLNELNESYEGK